MKTFYFATNFEISKKGGTSKHSNSEEFNTKMHTNWTWYKKVNIFHVCPFWLHLTLFISENIISRPNLVLRAYAGNVKESNVKKSIIIVLK
jgi:hypothetical protein